jgi:hypothetical protein
LLTQFICAFSLAFSCVRAAHAGRTHGIPMGFSTAMDGIYRFHGVGLFDFQLE